MSVKDTVLDETQSIQEYISEMAPTDELLRECLRQQQTETEDQPEEVPWHDKALHSMYHQQKHEVTDTGKSYQWLENLAYWTVLRY